MRFDSPVSETVKTRRSVRTYSDEAIDAERMRLLNEACASVNKGPFGEPARFELVKRPFRKGEDMRLSDYGLVRNPRYFFVGAVATSPMALEGYGYLMEHLVLYATELGLGTCWMGLFNREFFPDFKVGADELFPAIVVVGVPTERPRFGERMIRAAVRADRRRSWDELFFEGDFGRPLSRRAAGDYAGALDALRLAPSAGNAQPWRMVKQAGAGTLHLYLRNMRRLYYERGLHNIDIGIAMAHLELAAREAGLDGEWRAGGDGLSPLPDATEYRVSWFPH